MPDSQPSAGRLVLLSTTHRVPAGLLSYGGWTALAGAAEVCAGRPTTRWRWRWTPPA